MRKARVSHATDKPQDFLPHLSMRDVVQRIANGEQLHLILKAVPDTPDHLMYIEDHVGLHELHAWRGGLRRFKSLSRCRTWAEKTGFASMHVNITFSLEPPP